MGEAHAILHDIKSILGIGQCTAPQALGICVEFWVGALVAVGVLKVRQLHQIKVMLESKLSSKSASKKKSSKKKKKKKRKK